MRVPSQDALLESLAQQHEAKMAEQEAEAARVEESWVCTFCVMVFAQSCDLMDSWSMHAGRKPSNEGDAGVAGAETRGSFGGS